MKWGLPVCQFGVKTLASCTFEASLGLCMRSRDRFQMSIQIPNLTGRPRNRTVTGNQTIVTVVPGKESRTGSAGTIQEPRQVQTGSGTVQFP